MPKVTSVIVPYPAYLRIYEPLAAFPREERAYWEGYAARPGRPTCQDELRRSLSDLLATPPAPVPVHESGEAFVTEVDGVVCVCPWRTRLRGWQALGEVGGGLPPTVLDAVLPPVVREEAARDYEHWLARHPDARPWIRSATWHVPGHWFVLVADEEREWRPGTEGEPPVLRYRARMVEARRRLARGLRTVREAVGEGPVTEALVGVGRWLEEFHPRSLVELDYGGLVHALPADDLAEDHSAADAAQALRALRDGDGEAAGEAYERLVDRWRTVRQRGLAS